MAILRATVVLNKQSAIARDAVRNVWHFATPAVDPNVVIGKVGDAVEIFYDVISGYLSASIARSGTLDTGPRIDFAIVNAGGAGSLDDTIGGVFAQRTMTLAAGNANMPMPSEVAVALSFRGNNDALAEESGLTRPKSRLRGRVYIGPFGLVVLDQDGPTSTPKVKQEILTQMISAYNQLVTRLGEAGAPNCQHVVYSPTNGQTYPVVNAHVDNAYDIVRSRGERATGRTETAVTQPALV